MLLANLFTFAVIQLLTAALNVTAYDWVTGNSSVWLSANAYCETDTYMTKTWTGYSSGFVPTEVIDSNEKDVQGYVGYMPSQSTIYVVFRGSTSLQDWLDNLDVWQVAYPQCDGCSVHEGFYKAQQSVLEEVSAAVQSLTEKYPSYAVVVTGHSLGGALATLTALSLLDSGTAAAPRLFNFGSPRVGNAAFAEYASRQLIDHSRNTHYKDMVPHVPMHERFKHISNEWYEDEAKGGALIGCEGYEDPSCSYQWHITSVDDHMLYLDHYMGCDDNDHVNVSVSHISSDNNENMEENGRRRSKDEGVVSPSEEET